MSSATIDRALQNAKGNGQKVRRRGVAGSELRRSVPIRTFSDWGDPAPGHMEADLVSHSGPVAKGSWAWTLTLTDIATGWTECAPLLVREQTLLVEVLKELRKLMPFPLLGFDSDNDSVFINETVRDYCATTEIAFTRCRPYRKNDQAWVEQKNGSVVRRHSTGMPCPRRRQPVRSARDVLAAIRGWSCAAAYLAFGLPRRTRHGPGQAPSRVRQSWRGRSFSSDRR